MSRTVMISMMLLAFGDMPGLSRLLDDSIRPVDKDVFMRELAYYEIRSKP
jgi:hypothetical protein